MGKNIHKTPTASGTLRSEKREASHSHEKPGTAASLSTAVQHHTANPGTRNKARKENNKSTAQKENGKTSFVDDTANYVKHLEESTKKVELTHNYGKDTKHKNNVVC